MKIPKLARAMSQLDEDLILAAMEEPPKEKRHGWVKWAVAVACLGLVFAAALLHWEAPRDVEPRVGLTLEEASREGAFGKLFPTQVMDGYVLEGDVGVYGNPGTVLQAEFYNENLEDVLLIKIAAKEWFLAQQRDLPLNTVLYRETLQGRESEIYIDGGDYIVFYSFCKTDMADNRDFYDMVTSAPQFQGGDEKTRQSESE